MSLIENRVGDMEVSLSEVLEILGEKEYEEFGKCLSIIQMMIDEPGKMVGSEALAYAAKLSALRTRIGLRAQYYKTADKSLTTRRRKDLLMAMFSALEENINTLKLLGRVEARITGVIN